MAYTHVHVYLYTLVFLQSFSVLLCTSVYINHGIIKGQNLENSVRSPIKDLLLPEIKSMLSESLSKSSKSSLRSYLRSTALRRVIGNTISDTLQSKRIKRTIHSVPQRPRNRILDKLKASLGISLTRTNSNTRSRLEAILTRDSGTSTRKRAILEGLLNTHTRSRNQRHQGGSFINLARQLSANIERLNGLFPQTTQSTTRPTTTPAPIELHARRNDESHSTENPNKCLSVGYCFHGGSCIYDETIRITECLCTSNFGGYRCSKSTEARSSSNSQSPQSDILQQYSQWSRGWKIKPHKTRHSSRFSFLNYYS